MDFKPENFFIGVTEFFSVLLPGALLTWFFIGKMPHDNLNHYIIIPPTDVTKGAAFLLIAYITGNLIYVFASMLDHLLYNPLRNILFMKNSDYAFKRATKIRKEFVPDRALLEDVIDEDNAKAKENAEKKWYCAKEYNFLIFWSGLKKGILFWKKWCKEKERAHDEFKDRQQVMNTFKWGQHYLMMKHPQVINDFKRMEADSKFFRSLVIAFLIIAIYYFASHSFRQGILFIGISALSFYRFGDLRYKCTQRVYELIITSKHLN